MHFGPSANPGPAAASAALRLVSRLGSDRGRPLETLFKENPTLPNRARGFSPSWSGRPEPRGQTLLLEGVPRAARLNNCFGWKHDARGKIAGPRVASTNTTPSRLGYFWGSFRHDESAWDVRVQGYELSVMCVGKCEQVGIGGSSCNVASRGQSRPTLVVGKERVCPTETCQHLFKG